MHRRQQQQRGETEKREKEKYYPPSRRFGEITEEERERLGLRKWQNESERLKKENIHNKKYPTVTRRSSKVGVYKDVIITY